MNKYGIASMRIAALAEGERKEKAILAHSAFVAR